MKNYSHWYENPLCLNILEQKYLHEGEKFYTQVIDRVCDILDEDIRNDIRGMMKEGTFFPGGRTLYGAGSKGKFNATMSNCYIMKSPEDSLDSIYETNKLMARIFKTGGGIGVNVSKLRPNGAKTNNAARTSTGAVSFINLFNTTGEIIGFHGRRGATLVGLDVSHPDIEEFVDLRKTKELKAMNISVLMNDEFMKAVENNDKYTLKFHVEATGEDIVKEINARELYDKICLMNWDYGDPGMLFMDAVRTHNMQCYNKAFNIEICNPCAEYTGPAFNSCNLGSLNLYNFVIDKFTEHAKIDYQKLEYCTEIAVMALDNILDYGYDMQPLEENKKVITDWRSIGLGFFGFADMCIALGIRYDSDEAIKTASQICKSMFHAAVRASTDLASDKGAFKRCNKKELLRSPLIKQFAKTDKELYNDIKKYGMRNAQLISIAPTGSLSLLANGSSSGLEPIFKIAYERSSHGLEDRNISFEVNDKAILDLIKYHNLDPDISAEELKALFPFIVESVETDPIQRVKLQAAMQKEIDNAISSTITLDKNTSVEKIKEIYMLSWKLGLKGITVFRNGCKRAAILGTKKKEEKKQEDHNNDTMNNVLPISRKTKGRLEGATYRKRTACVKSLYVTINRDENDNIFEIFTNKSVHGCSANIATITRMTSLALRSGVKVDKVIEELKSNTCQACITLNKEHPEYGLSMSCPIAIAEALQDEYNRLNTEEDKSYHKEESNMLECPKCHKKTLIPEGKCVTCMNPECGYSKCD